MRFSEHEAVVINFYSMTEFAVEYDSFFNFLVSL